MSNNNKSKKKIINEEPVKPGAEAEETVDTAVDDDPGDDRQTDRRKTDRRESDRRARFEKNKSEYSERRKRRQADWDIRPYLAIGSIVFLVFCCCMGVIFVVFRYEKITALFAVLSDVLQPIIIGLIMGYLLNPAMEWIERPLLSLFLEKSADKEKTRKTVRTVSAILTVLFFVGIIAVIIALLIPALISSVKLFLASLSGYVKQYDEVVSALDLNDKLKAQLLNMEQTMYNFTNDMSSWVMENILPKAQEYIATLGTGIMSVVVVLKNVLVGLIVAIYVLCEKDHFEGQGKRAVYAIFPVKYANKIVALIHKSNKIFGGFIVGKVIDSIIIGLITFIFCTCVGMPYTLLISVVIAVTNIIPFFGPFIGGIPAFILVMLASPWHGVVFGIFVIVLQQVDGNIIGPKILGDSTGLSSFWVIVAILLGGGLWGFPGMLFGVPLFAIIYYLVTKFMDFLTEKRGMPAESMDYTYVERVDEETGELINDKERLDRLDGLNLKNRKLKKGKKA